MPLYEYQCDACGKRFEVIQKFADAPADTCRHCGQGPVHKLLSSPAIQFKGTGWYITDYAKKSNSDAGKSGSPASSDSSSGGKSEGGSSEGGSKSDKSEKSEKSGKSDTPAAAPTAAAKD